MQPKSLPKKTRIKKKSLKKPVSPSRLKLLQSKLVSQSIKSRRTALVLLLLFMLGGIYISQTVLKDLPSPRTLEGNSYPISTQIFDRNGALLYEIYADQHRTPIRFEAIPEHLKQATISIEDQDFYRHWGFSFQGIARALKNTLVHDQLQGGSTITQQLVKTALLTPERTLRRKIREAVLTIGTELLYSKDEILAMYLNHIPYGGTAYGIEAAAQRFFGIPAAELSLEEAALLAGLPQAPTRYSPFTNPERAKARQHEVLRRMAEDGYINHDEVNRAFDATLSFAPPATNIDAPHFVFHVKELLEDKYGLEVVERGGLRVTTSLDLELQKYAQASVSAEIAALEDYRVSNGAALLTKPATGEILAMVGSIDYFNTENDGQVNLTNRLRQPGSSIKPLNYVTALQTKRLTPASMLLDIPTCFNVTGQPSYCPRNYDGRHRGPVLFRDALATSLNIPAVKILAINGIDSMIATASSMGIQSFNEPERYGLSLTLGGGEVTMLDMATAFGVLANQGVLVPLQPILEVTNSRGVVLESYNADEAQASIELFMDETVEEADRLGTEIDGLTRVLNRAPAYLISDILADNRARTPAFGGRSELYIPKQTVSVKTGTTNDLKDNWTFGYTPQYLVGSWVGNNDNTPMNQRVVSGVTGAAPIWNALMTHVLEELSSDDTVQMKPSTIAAYYVCGSTGLRPEPGVECSGREEMFWTEAPPTFGTGGVKNYWVEKGTGKAAFAADEPQPDINLDNIELQPKLVLSDPFVKDFCVDCNWISPDSDKVTYPKININMTTFSFLTPSSAPKKE